MDTVCVGVYVAADISRQRGGQCDDKRHGEHRREQGFLFGQLGKLKASTRALYGASWRERQAADATYGERGEHGKEGRFGDKSGKYVGVVFEASSHEEKIKAIYGAVNLWAWLRYWHIESADNITLLLMDKGYYDYDYERPSREDIARKRAARSDAELESRIGGSILGRLLRRREVDAEDIQREMLNRMGEGDRDKDAKD